MWETSFADDSCHFESDKILGCCSENINYWLKNDNSYVYSHRPDPNKNSNLLNLLRKIIDRVISQ